MVLPFISLLDVFLRKQFVILNVLLDLLIDFMVYVR